MNPSISHITEQEFAAYESGLRLFQDDNARRFAKLIMPNAEQVYVMSWRSDSIEPCIVATSCGSAIYVGVDEHLACVTSDGTVIFAMDLGSPLLAIESTNTTTIAVCELQLLVLSESGSVESSIDFPDVVDHYALRGGRLQLSFMDGTSKEICI